jgi:hypothetical protein
VASTYSNLKIQLMATGENSGTWGNVTNANLGDAIEQAIVETATVTFASANVTLTLSDSNSKQDARALRLNLTGTTAGARDLIVPAIQKPYLVNNGTADTITVKVSGQTGVAVPASTSMLLYNNGTDVVVAFNRVVGNLVGNVSGSAATANTLTTARTIAISGNVTGTATSFDGSGNISIPVTAINADGITSGTLGVARGGTGATTLNSEAVVIGNSTGAVKFVAPGTSGNVLTSNGSAWLSQAISAGGNFVQQVYTSPATWTKPANVKAARVYVSGGGGGGGSVPSVGPSATKTGGQGGQGGTGFKYISAPSIPGPVTVTVGGGGSAGATGGTSSFGPFLSATGGTGGSTNPSPGNVNSTAVNGTPGTPTGSDVTMYQQTIFASGQSIFAEAAGFGIVGIAPVPAGGQSNGTAATGRVAGGGGSQTRGVDFGNPGAATTGGAGAGGLIIVEEFY